MKSTRNHHSCRAGFTLVEVLISLAIVTLVMGMTMSTFLFGLRMMYKDNQRLITNTTLRYFMAQVAKSTLDASEFYIYPSYATLDGNVDSIADQTTAVTDSYGIDLYHGDCLVLVTRTSLDEGSNIRQVSIYYRTTTDPNKEGAIRCYEDKDYGASGTTQTLDEILDAINLSTSPNFAGSKELAARSLGRPKNDGSGDRYPVFSSKAPSMSAENESVSINAEIINGNTVNNLLSSSSFNYTISPRR
ncbi:MAG: prepilin-type N-terminal cleavage/methylation domain-containing protein [Opitutae bacterium]|nr:prepilin-type N-terminal cleavage/methylation domain-containing protein [Opitutae bacterium]